jgi:tetratricopeptide (TPR) repeat protein
MKKTILWVGIMAFLSVGSVFASGEANKKTFVTAQRQLAVNRSLLAKTEAEYRHLSDEEAKKSSADIAKKLSDLQYKIKALREDAQRLQSELPKNERASEFLKDLLDHSPVDVEREKKVSQKLESIYALHEKALTLVSQNNYEGASKVYEEIILESPDDDEAYLLLGHTRLISSEYEKAKEAFLNAIHIDRANSVDIPRFYENILMENPEDDAAYAHLGFAYWILGRDAEAKEAFEGALATNPENLEAKTALNNIRATAQ